MMNKRQILSVLCCVAPLLAAASIGLGANKYVQGLAPDWNQAYDYPDAYDPTGPGPDPNPGQPINPWDAWCTPSSAAMMMGHWDDVKNAPNTGDGVAEGNQGAVRPANAVNWSMAASWHDYTADGQAARPGPGAPPPGVGNATDIGWYMNTNNTGDFTLAFLPGMPHTGTYVGNAAQGLNNFLADRGSALAGQAGTTYVNVGGLPPVVALIKAEIDANRTVLGHFRWWVNPQPIIPGGPGPEVAEAPGEEQNEADFESTDNFADYEFWPSQSGEGIGDEEWNGQEGEEGLGHTVLLVGYSDDRQGNVTHLIPDYSPTA